MTFIVPLLVDLFISIQLMNLFCVTFFLVTNCEYIWKIKN